MMFLSTVSDPEFWKLPFEVFDTPAMLKYGGSSWLSQRSI